jgi:aspartate aminotransferase
MNLSNRILKMQFSPIRKLSSYADETKKRGIEVYHLNIGQPDALTPEPFFKAISNFNESVLKYTESQGMDMLQESFIEYYKKWGTEFTKDELIITNGGSEAIMLTFLSICDPEDEILAPEPFYTNYSNFAEISSAKIISFFTKADDGFHLPSKETIISKITDKTKAIMICNPGNPTGVVYNSEELRMLGNIVKEYDLYLIADEVYREFVYDNLQYTSVLTMKDIEDRIIVIDSISKRYSACGARIGLVASKNKNLMFNIMKLCQSRLCVPTIEQIGAAALKDTPESYFIKTREEYQKRRNLMMDELMKIPGVICQKPMGAFYIMAKLPLKNAEDFAKFLLTDFNYEGKTVMVAPAAGFYATPGLGIDEIRLSYCVNCDSLRNAMNILNLALEEYKKIYD